ncbi:phage head-tail joining protein [Pedobacter sp. Hv1]|uniref:phage head-tail joining protein n=1 Tax=Pedobacter sp. Hv1 TaxID=1740090 RepID=UPI000ACD0709
MYTIEQYNILSSAIAQGALRVRYGDKEVEYRSLKDMLAVQKLMYEELFPTKIKTSRTYGSYSKDIQ